MSSETAIMTLKGIEIPYFLYGTAWKEDRTRELVLMALAAGFRGIDTANQRRHYHEAAVGDAIAETIAAGKASREDLFIQTKFTFAPGQDHRLPYDLSAPYSEQVPQSFTSSLEHLKTSYVDSYVLHGPMMRSGLTDADWEAWGAMEALCKAGKARLLGVSNVSLEQLQALYERAELKPAFVQNRCYARTKWDGAVRLFCTEHDIVYQGFSLLTANVSELQSAPVREVAGRQGRSVPEIIFRFAMQIGMLPLTGTSNAEHMRRDLSCSDFELGPEDLDMLENMSAPRDGV